MMPTYVALPSEYRDAYHVAPVVAAIPLDSPNAYAVTAIDQSPLSSPVYFAAEVQLGGNGSWYADETFPSGSLPDALGDMACLAGRVYPRFL